jgi:eukaryotic-like serine/threonine-protein kinase
MACLDDDTLLALVGGQLSESALDAAERHLDECPTCRQAVALGLERGPRSPTLTIGDTLGRYVVLERIGAGAMGEVFAAWDPQLDRKVALKLLKASAASDEHQTRLLREAQTLARLSHPNVVTVFDVGRWEGQRFMALEFVDGGSVRTWLSAKSRGPRDVLSVFAQAGRGLAAAHQAGVVHRDFKPDNVLVRGDGRAQVTDFGLASEAKGPLSSDARPGVSLTGTGALLGTPAYMAPAQLDGEEATAASDQFSFCVALFESLTGQRPWSATSVEALRRSMRDGPTPAFPSTSEVPAHVRKAVLRGLSVQEAARWPSMVALVDALERNDSARTSRLIGAGVVVALIAGLLFLGARSRLPEACSVGQQRLATVWGPSRRAALTQTFEATGLTYAPSAMALVTQAFDARMGAWKPQHLEACLGSSDDRQSATWSARLGCLEERVAELDAIAQILERGGPASVNKAARIVDRLPAPGVCLEVDALGRVPLDDQSRQVFRGAREVAARTAALYETGAFEEAERLSDPGDAGVPPIVVSLVHYERGRVLQKLGRLDEAKALLTQSALASTGLRDDDMAGAAWAELGFLVGFLQVKPEEALAYVDLARAHLPASKDLRSQERVEGALANILTRQGKFDEAEAHFERVLALVEARTGPDTFYVARALTNLGNARLRRKHTADAVPLIERALALFEKTLGAQHPDTFQALNSLGVALGEAGRLEASIVIFHRVVDGYLASLGPTHPNVGTAFFNVADANSRLGRHAPALASYRRALDVWTGGLGPDSVQRVGALAGIGRSARGLGDLPAALEALEEARVLCMRAACEPADEGDAAWWLAVVAFEAKRPWGEVEAALLRSKKAFGAMGTAGAADVAKCERALTTKRIEQPAGHP